MVFFLATVLEPNSQDRGQDQRAKEKIVSMENILPIATKNFIWEFGLTRLLYATLANQKKKSTRRIIARTYLLVGIANAQMEKSTWSGRMIMNAQKLPALVVSKVNACRKLFQLPKAMALSVEANRKKRKMILQGGPITTSS